MTKEFDARNENKSRSVCAAMAESADTDKRVLSEKERRILDMWPRFEDGGFVQFGDVVNGVNARSFVFAENGVMVTNLTSVPAYGEFRSYGEPFKRPAPEVLDADGMEIKVGDRIYSIETGNSYTVRSINGSGTIEFNGFNDKGWSPKYFMHMQPTIDADGVLIKVGDTVWHHSGFAHGVVTSIDAGSLMGTVRYVNGGVEFRDAAKDLTHTRPDSWERLEEDAEKNPFDYCKDVGHRLDTCENSEAYKARDIVRRAKKLVGVER